MGILIKKKFWKNGYALESLGKFLEKTFLSHNKLYVIEYVCNTNNLASFFLFNRLFSFLLTINKNLHLKILQDNSGPDMVKFLIKKV